jgi:UDP-N-acetylmuramoyl-L-alanyl-D-glutamate--2,6-diaminopimelate ligase
MLQTQSHVRGVSLRELFDDAQFFGAGDIRVGSCSADSRSCRSGDLFVALTGATFDGHDFARQALARGATAILAERLLPVGDVPVCVVPDSRVAHGRLCQALAGNPSERLKVIGVTGTNGKTTTTALIASVLSSGGHRTGTLGTLGYSDGYQWESATMTTPAAPVLASSLARMEAAGCSHAVLEVSSHALSQSRVAGIRLDAACVTNVRQDHLDYHGTLRNYRNAKARLFRHLAPESLVVLNADDPVSGDYMPLLHGPVLTVSLGNSAGLDNAASLTAQVVERYRSEQTFLLSAGSETLPVRTALIGDHNVYNCLQAAAVGLAYGLDLATVVRGLEAVDRVSGRLERLECGQTYSVFVDYAHTPHALASVLDSLRQVTEGRLICVFGAGGQRDRRKRPLMGRAVAARADLAIITTDNPRREDPEDIATDILSGARDQSKVELIPDRTKAIEWALSLAGPGDCVLLAGKGHEKYQVIGAQCVPFDDREVARRWLYNLASPTGVSWLDGAWMAVGNS